ncbi:MAG: bifunctional metallophosphatase/5'-nucleotidase [Chloroflexi bacterium]|nr:bifunctional metallophosphatase/5'-nucleotidase [Chloroflexota bacterium]
MLQITILYTADIHGQMTRLLRAALLARTLREELDAAGHHALLLDAGDVEERTLIESDLSKGIAPFRVLKAAGYDACVPGHSTTLTYGPTVLQSIVQHSGLPVLCANLLAPPPESQPLPGTQNSLIVSYGPARLGLFGLTTELNPAYERYYHVSIPDAIITARAQVQALRDQGCTVIGLLSHLGYERDLQVAEAVPGLDFIIGGHSHTLLRSPAAVRSVPICHAGERGRFIGQLDLEIDARGSVVQWYGQLHRVPESGPFHPEAQQVWDWVQRETQHALDVPIGYLNEAVDLAPDRACGVGQLLADALRVRLRADIAFCVGGHLQAGLPQGPVRLRDLVRACRSPASAAVTQLSGAQIIRALEHGANPAVWRNAPRSMRGLNVGILQVSGLTYQYDPSGRPGCYTSNVRVLDKPIELDTVYRVAATDYELIPQRRYVPDLDISSLALDIPRTVRDVLHDHLATFNPLTPGLRSRIIVTASAGVHDDSPPAS